MSSAFSISATLERLSPRPWTNVFLDRSVLRGRSVHSASRATGRGASTQQRDLEAGILSPIGRTLSLIQALDPAWAAKVHRSSVMNVLPVDGTLIDWAATDE